MKKKLLALALVVAAGMSVASAQCPKENCDRQKCTEKKCDDNRCANRECKAACPFDDLNLTDAQKTQLKALGEKNRAEKKECQNACKEARKAAAKEACEKRKGCKESYLKEVKAILTPEQYVTFLEQSYVRAGRRHDGDRRHDCKANGKDRRNGPTCKMQPKPAK